MPKSPRQHPPRPPASSPEIIDPRWLLKAVALTIAAAAFCAWLTLWLLVYQGQWQLVLHPDTDPALTTDLPIQGIRFGASDSGQPGLSGFWLPAADGFPRAVPTLLYLPDGSGRLADDLPAIAQLYQLPVNIFAFDYRGFGASDHNPHPTEARMAQDAASALDYLTTTRHIPASTIIPYGAGLGAALATQLATQHPEIPALILESPVPNPNAVAAQDPRTSFVPLHLLFHETFEIAPNLQALKTPKLLLTAGPSHVIDRPGRALLTPSDLQPAIAALYKSAATPSYIAHLAPWSPDASPGTATAYRESILRFLNEYLPTSQPPSGPPQ